MSKFKLHWGWSMVIVYAIFMTVFLFYFYRSFKELETNEMVTEDYYQKELVYGEVLAKRQNADTMRVQVQIVQDTTGLRIIFPKYLKNVEGTIVLYKPDNSKLDSETKIELNADNEQVISKQKFIPGRWDVILDWKSNNTDYYKKEKMTFK